MAPQAVERQLDGAEPHPLAAADDATAPRGDVVRGGDGQADGAAELDAVGALVEVDQHGQRVARTRLLPRRARDGLGRLARRLAGRRLDADGGAHLAEITGQQAATEDLLGAAQVSEPRGDLTAGEGLDDR